MTTGHVGETCPDAKLPVRIYRYIYLNIYTLLLDLLLAGLLLITAALVYFKLHTVLIIACCGGIFFLFKTVGKLHMTTPEKYRALDELNVANMNEFRPELYSTHMNAPCTRRIVRLSLKDTNRLHEFSFLKNNYQKYFFAPKRRTEFKITFYDENNNPVTEADETL